MNLSTMASKASRMGGPIVGQASINAQGAGPAFGTHICDVEVDRETGAVKILRYTAVQDAGRAIHPSYVEGQIQGGAVPGYRLGTQRGIHRQRRWPTRKIRASLTIGCLWHRICR